MNVRIRTETIALNSKYVILRVGQRFQIISNVLPENASQNVNYKSLDSEIATVSSDGMVTARKSGNTSIMVSTKDVVESVSIIINQDQNQVADYSMEEEKTEQNVFDNIIYADKIQKWSTKIILVIGGGICTLGIIIYIIVKRKYWFW